MIRMVRIQMISVTSDKIIEVRLREKPTTEDLIQSCEQILEMYGLANEIFQIDMKALWDDDYPGKTYDFECMDDWIEHYS